MYQTYFKKYDLAYKYCMILAVSHLYTYVHCCFAVALFGKVASPSCCEVEGKLAIVLISSKHLNNKKFSSVIHAGMIEGSNHCRKIHMSHVSLFCKVFLQ